MDRSGNENYMTWEILRATCSTVEMGGFSLSYDSLSTYYKRPAISSENIKTY